MGELNYGAGEVYSPMGEPSCGAGEACFPEEGQDYSGISLIIFIVSTLTVHTRQFIMELSCTQVKFVGHCRCLPTR